MILQTIALPLGDVALQKWSGRRDSNSRQPRWQRGALPLSYSRSLAKCKFKNSVLFVKLFFQK